MESGPRRRRAFLALERIEKSRSACDLTQGFAQRPNHLCSLRGWHTVSEGGRHSCETRLRRPRAQGWIHRADQSRILRRQGQVSRSRETAVRILWRGDQAGGGGALRPGGRVPWPEIQFPRRTEVRRERRV